MPTLTIETTDAEKPILFIVGESHPLISTLVEEHQGDFKIAIVSSTYALIPNSNVYKVDPANAALVKNLKERIDYAVVFCEKQEIKEYIGPIFEKFADDKTKTVILCDVDSFEDFTDIALATKQASSFYFLLLGDVYSENPEFYPNSASYQLIDSAIHNKEAIIVGNDLSPIFPIYYKDAISAINQLLLSPRKKSRYFFLFYENPQTYISALHIIERVEPDLRISYKEEEKNQKLDDRTSLRNTIEEKLGENIATLDSYFDGFEKSLKHFVARGPIIKQEPKETIFEVGKKVIKPAKPQVALWLKLTLTAFIVFILVEVGAAIGSFLLLKSSIADFGGGNYKQAAINARSAKTFFELVKPGASLISEAANKTGNDSLNKNLKLFGQATNIADIAARDTENLTNIVTGISKDTLEQSIADAVYLYFLGQQLESETNNKNIGTYLTPEMSSILSLARVAPQVAGFDGEKHYLLLFQNNGELRPTGGFIGSVGELTLANGKIKDLTLQDVYEYDGQLKNHIEPHYIVRRYLQPHLYLRDSNFNPDFQQSASTAALLYNLETGRKVDGVIGVNFEAVRQIIGAIGPIDLTSYNTSLNRDNAFDFLEKTIDNNFFAGSTQKKDVLQALFDKIMLKLEDRNNFVKVARLIPQFATSKDILFAFSKPSIQSAFSSVGFGGELTDSRMIGPNTINDYLAINEANIGVNKANVNVKRSTDYTATLSQNKISSKLTHKLSNKDAKGYRIYLRIFTPLGSIPTSIKIDGVKQDTVAAITDFKTYERRNFQAPAGLELDQQVESGKTVFGFITEVLPGKDQTIEVEYDNGVNVPNESIIDYSLLLIKQPGTSTFPFALNLIYGSGYTPKEVENATLENGVIILKKNVASDVDFKAQLLRR